MREETGGSESSGEGRERKPCCIESAKRSGHVAADEEFVGPEFEEDAYYCYSLAATPSFDELDASDSEEILVHWHQDSGEIEEVEEADLSRICQGGAPEGSLRATTRGELRRLRARIRARLLALVGRGEDAALHRTGSLSPSLDSVASELQGLSVEEQERQKAEWSAELARIEDEIQTLREVLASKVRTAHELKRKLGISVWKELSEDVNQGLKNVKESQVFQKTESVFKSTAEKTTSILGGFGSGLSMKIGQMRNSDSFRSLEEKVGSAYENVKGRVTPSRSNSTQSFDEALREAGASRRASAAPSATSPTIPEDRVLS
ncbi:tumor protein D52 isoform X2 [Phymastichus coffea]|uniref:tumor protein D52 isoform X2 n=1 Tax=Phymastichus coffea TaxID=108790 RepID=UPI00273C4913|nr:tumor protein D52 isoform X2 [Phymastichus coffea]